MDVVAIPQASKLLLPCSQRLRTSSMSLCASLPIPQHLERCRSVRTHKPAEARQASCSPTHPLKRNPCLAGWLLASKVSLRTSSPWHRLAGCASSGFTCRVPAVEPELAAVCGEVQGVHLHTDGGCRAQEVSPLAKPEQAGYHVEQADKQQCSTQSAVPLPARVSPSARMLCLT